MIPGLGTPLGPALQFAGRFRERIDLPVFHAQRIPDLATARFAITEGLVDMVGMMRAHMADPHIVRKLEAGEPERIRTCVGASYCINRIYRGLDALCIQNPATGREETIPHVAPPTTGPRRRVVVVGAGVAGLEAARVAAERGHEVVLLEAASEPGGQVRLAARATPRRSDLIGIVDWLVSECRILGVDLRFDTVADGPAVLALRPDVVVVATGGRPRTPPLDRGRGARRDHVGHHRRGRDALDRRGPALRRPRHGGRPVLRRAPDLVRRLAGDRVTGPLRRLRGDRHDLPGLSWGRSTSTAYGSRRTCG